MKLRRLEQSEQPMQSINLQISFRPVSIKLGSILAVLSMSRLLASPGHTGVSRSLPSSTPFIIGQRSSSPQGQDQGLIPTTYFKQKAGEALRVTRWFRHE